MSLETTTERGRRRTYARRFDHDEARRLRESDPKRWSYSRLAEHFGVSESAVWQVLTGARDRPEYRARIKQYHWDHFREPCKGGCGKLVWLTGGHGQGSTAPRSGMCKECLGKEQAFTVRTSELLCSRCNEWKPDADFPAHAKAKARRGRHSLCRPCQTEARREHRARNREADNAYSRAYRRRKKQAA